MSNTAFTIREVPTAKSHRYSNEELAFMKGEVKAANKEARAEARAERKMRNAIRVGKASVFALDTTAKGLKVTEVTANGAVVTVDVGTFFGLTGFALAEGISAAIAPVAAGLGSVAALEALPAGIAAGLTNPITAPVAAVVAVPVAFFASYKGLKALSRTAAKARAKVEDVRNLNEVWVILAEGSEEN